MNEDLLKKIKTLPPLPETIRNVQRVCADPNASLADLSRIIEKDPMITANILKATNSPLYGFSREITSINQAVSLFGMSTIKGFAISTAVAHTFPIDLSPYGLSSEKFSAISQMQSSLAFQWLRGIERSMGDILLTASFLLETGIIVISDFLIKGKADAAFKQVIAGGVTLEEGETRFTGSTNEEVASKIFEQWNFDKLIVESIRYSITPDKADPEIYPYAAPLAVIRTTINIKEQLTDNSIAQAKELIEKYNLNMSQFEKAIAVLTQA